MMSFLSKSELGFYTYGLMSVLGPGSPKLVFKARIPRLKYFLKFDAFIRSKL